MSILSVARLRCYTTVRISEASRYFAIYYTVQTTRFVMDSHPYLVLVILYTLTFYFSMHQTSHLAYLEADPRVRLDPFLTLLMNIEQISGLLFLVWYGYRTVWCYPLILAAIGFPSTLVLTTIERATKLHRSAWAVSILGILVVPVLLYLMVTHINATAD